MKTSNLWSDMSKIEVFGSNRRMYVRHNAEHKVLPNCMVPTVRHGGGSVMVWSCYSFDGVSDLTRVTGRMDKEVYKTILDDHVLVSILRLSVKVLYFSKTMTQNTHKTETKRHLGNS